MMKQCDARKVVESKLVLASVVATLAILLLALPAQAQILYGSMTGNVTDTTNAILPNAQVRAFNVGTGIAGTAETDSSGIFRFTELQPGIYKVTFTAAGFWRPHQERQTVFLYGF